MPETTTETAMLELGYGSTPSHTVTIMPDGALAFLAGCNARGEAALHQPGDAVVMPFGVAYCYEYGTEGKRGLFCAIPTQFDEWIAPGTDYIPAIHGTPYGAVPFNNIADLLLSM